MFTEDDRERVRTRVLERAREDQHITGAGMTGSAARGTQDRWSDVDLFFGVAPGITVEQVLGEWSAFMYRELGALHRFDLEAGSALYRAFLLPKCLEVDLAFTPAADFGARGPHFRTVFGEAFVGLSAVDCVVYLRDEAAESVSERAEHLDESIANLLDILLR